MNQQEILRKYTNHGIELGPYELQKGIRYIIENADDNLLRVLTFEEDAYYQMDLLVLQTKQEILDSLNSYMIKEGPEGAFFTELEEPIAYKNLKFEKNYQIVIPRFFEYDQSKEEYKFENERREILLSRSKELSPTSRNIP